MMFCQDFISYFSYHFQGKQVYLSTPYGHDRMQPTVANTVTLFSPSPRRKVRK